MSDTIKIPTPVMLPIGKLQLDPLNPRSMPDEEMKNLMSGIREFGLVQPVVARKEDGLIIGGHQRVEAMRRVLVEQGKTKDQVDRFKVSVIQLEDVDDSRAKVLNIALNRIHGDWDYTKLSQVLSELSQFPDIALTGFTQNEIDDIVKLGSPGAVTVAAAPDVDVDAQLAAEKRTFSFEVATDEEAAVCGQVLRGFGMTGPMNAGSAFVSAMKAAENAASLNAELERLKAGGEVDDEEEDDMHDRGVQS